MQPLLYEEFPRKRRLFHKKVSQSLGRRLVGFAEPSSQLFYLQNKADHNMNERNTEQHIRYLEEVCACLHRAGFETQPLEESQLLSIVYTQVTGRITLTGAIGTIRSSS